MSDRIYFAGTVTAEGRRVRGSVQLAGARTWRNNEWVEIDPAALAKADASDVVARWNHDENKVLGRTTNGTLRVKFTDDGIAYETDDLPNTTYANDTLELLRGKYVPGSSFEIEGLRSETYTDDDGSPVRRYTHIDRINDVSPTPHPAFVTSTAAAFRKESTPVNEETTTTTEATVEIEVNPSITFKKEPDGKSDTFRTAEAFARKQELPGLEQAMENLIAGGLDSAARAETYEAFAKVYDERKAVDTEAKERQERIALAHQLRTGKGPKAPEAEAGLLASDDYAEAFGRFLRTGDSRSVEQFAQSIAGTGAEGGYAVPDGFLNRVTETMKAYGGIAGVSDSITTSTGESLRWPSNNDTANSAAIATEGSAVGSGGADLVLGSVTLGAYTYDATGTGNVPLLVSKELLQDSAFDFEGFVARKLGERIGRKMAADFANGTGSSSAPVGLLTKTPDSMTATSMYAALVEHFFQIDQAYRDDARWVLGDTTLAKVFNSVDDSGRPLFQSAGSASGAATVAGTLLGKPVTIDQASANNVAFGDIRRGYIIRYVRGLQIDVDPYTNIKSRQLAFHAWARADANVQDSAAYSVSDYSSVLADAIVSG